MGHAVQLIIGTGAALARFLDAWVNAFAVELSEGWSAAPMTDDLYEEIRAEAAGEDVFDVFGLAPPGLDWAMCEATRDGGALAYIETDYFGGTGSQAAGAWRDGACILEPRSSEDGGDAAPVNTALMAIGVAPAEGMDAFDAIGLGLRRSTSDYLPGNPD